MLFLYGWLRYTPAGNMGIYPVPARIYGPQEYFLRIFIVGLYNFKAYSSVWAMPAPHLRVQPKTQNPSHTFQAPTGKNNFAYSPHRVALCNTCKPSNCSAQHSYHHMCGTTAYDIFVYSLRRLDSGRVLHEPSMIRALHAAITHFFRDKTLNDDNVKGVSLRVFVLLAVFPVFVLFLAANAYIALVLQRTTVQTEAIRTQYIEARSVQHLAMYTLVALKRAASLMPPVVPEERERYLVASATALRNSALQSNDEVLAHLRLLHDDIAKLNQAAKDLDSALQHFDTQYDQAAKNLYTFLALTEPYPDLHKAALDFIDTKNLSLLRQHKNRRDAIVLSEKLHNFTKQLKEGLDHTHPQNIAEMATHTQDAMGKTLSMVLDIQNRKQDLQQRLQILDTRFKATEQIIAAPAERQGNLALEEFDALAVRVQRTVVGFSVFGTLALLGIALGSYLVLIKPLGQIVGSLRVIQSGKNSMPIGQSPIREINRAAFLLNTFKDHLHAMYAYSRALEEEKLALKTMVIKDGLTGIFNRRFFDEQLKTALAEHNLTMQPLSLLMIDVDQFKAFNDSMGHAIGDECLIQVANALERGLLRAGDKAFRYGGEEFSILLPGTSLSQAYALAERLRSGIEALCIHHPKSFIGPCITVSIGLASLIPGQELAPRAFITMADEALYRAKNTGANKVCVAETPPNQGA